MDLLKVACQLVPLEERVGLHDGMNVLDVGCGYGELLSGSSEKKIQQVGLDLARYKLVKAHRTRPNVSFVLGDACSLPFQTKTFDVVTSQQCVSHVWNLDLSLKEMLRVCKHTFYLEDSNMLNPIVFLALLFRFGPCWLWNRSRVYNITKPDECGKKEDIHSMFWWKRKMRSLTISTRKRFHNPFLNWFWQYFGPDCIFTVKT